MDHLTHDYSFEHQMEILRAQLDKVLPPEQLEALTDEQKERIEKGINKVLWDMGADPSPW